MTEITATYVSASSFTVSGSKLDEFSPGRAVWANCGADGVRYAFVASSSYSSPNTTVTLDTNESQSLTANLASVLFGRVKYGTTKGNEPLQNLWVMRGHRNGLNLEYKDSDEIYINTGSFHIDDDSSENIYCAQSQITKQLTSLSASTWYWVYVNPPSSGLVLSSSEIEYSSTVPTYDQVKKGWYHPSTTDWRALGPVYSNSASNILRFSIRDKFYLFTDVLPHANWMYTASPSNSWVTYQFSHLPIGNIVTLFYIVALYSNTGSDLHYRITGAGGEGIPIAHCEATSPRGEAKILLNVDVDKKLDFKWNGDPTTNSWWANIMGFILPDGM